MSRPSTGSVLRKLSQATLSRLDSLIPLIIADDSPDDLHALRIEVRRLRAVLGSLRPALADGPRAHADTLRLLCRQLGAHTTALRDLDVLLADHERRSRRLPERLRGGGASIWEQLRRRRADAHAALVTFLYSDACQHALAAAKAAAVGLDAEPSAPFLTLGLRRLMAQMARVESRAAQVAGSRHDDDLHRLRVRLKGLRYLFDVLQPVLPARKGRDVRKVMRRAQDELGRFHDLCVQQALYEDMLGDGAATPVDELLTLAGLVAQMHRRRLKRRKLARRAAASLSGPALNQLHAALKGMTS
ncbi:MAG: CHAD domain-containing protein [Oceanococcaceae bacterium]